jgi:hypothetical protein
MATEFSTSHLPAANTSIPGQMNDSIGEMLLIRIGAWGQPLGRGAPA